MRRWRSIQGVVVIEGGDDEEDEVVVVDREWVSRSGCMVADGLKGELELARPPLLSPRCERGCRRRRAVLACHAVFKLYCSVGIRLGPTSTSERVGVRQEGVQQALQRREGGQQLQARLRPDKREARL